jgi:hypothetical protein
LKKQTQFVKGNLEKQSQFVWGRIGVRSYLKGNYGKKLDLWGEKTKPIYSYCVLRAAYCEWAFGKTNPISVTSQACSGELKKQTQFWQAESLNIRDKADILLFIRLSGEVEQKP